MTGKEGISCYCMKCKSSATMVDFHIKTSKNGRKIAVGKCKKCNNNVAKILSKEDAAKFQ